LDVTQTQQLPETRDSGEGCLPSAEDTSALPVVEEAPHRSRLHRATNLLALGQAHEAANLCREELEDFPESGDAYALLAMAEEQAGHRALAIDLLQELLLLDPTRAMEAEHLAELQREQEELEAQEPTAEEKEEQIRRLQPVALLMLAAAAVCLLASLVALGVAHHHRTQALAAYDQAMTYGAWNMNYHFYPEATGWYAQALRLYPDDPAARARYAQAVQAAQASGQPVTAAPPVSINPNASPFPPVTIGPPSGATNALGAGDFPTPPGTTPPSLVRGNQPGAGGNGTPTPDWTPEPTPTPPGRLNPPLINPPATPPTNPPAGSVPPPPPPPPPPKPRGQITIENVTPAAGAGDSLDQADGLRARGGDQENQGQYSAAAKSFRAAVSAYKSAQAQHPGQRQAIQTSIDSVQAQINVCEKRSQ
jgi:tetratricopeptide (TPR) repeat protein